MVLSTHLFKHFLRFLCVMIFFAGAMLTVPPAVPGNVPFISAKQEPIEQTPENAKPTKARYHSDGIEGATVHSTDAAAAGKLSEESVNLNPKTPGFGAVLGSMLDSLFSLTNASESRIRSLFSSLPLVFPDLYRVFITL